MRAIIRDKEALMAVVPQDLTSYLKAAGWRRSGDGGADVSYWKYGDDREILVPLNPGFADYAVRVAEVLVELERVENRSQPEILRDINFAGVDVIRVTAPQGDEKTGAVPFEVGVGLVEHAKNMMAAAATTAVRPQAVIPSRRPPEAEEYLKTIRLGQTEKGSYVLTILSDIRAVVETDTLDLFQSLPSFPRKVTLTLSKALTALRKSTAEVEEPADIEAFREDIARGVSANLCEAVAGILETARDAGRVDLDIAWASHDPVRETPSTFEFTVSEADVLIRAAKLLRSESPLRGIVTTGIVENLHRGENELEGTATIHCVIDNKIRKLRAKLTPEVYEIAIEAHRSKRAVVFRADIDRIRRAFHATNIDNFRITED